MCRSFSRGLILLAAGVALLRFATEVEGATITRGPYLQMGGQKRMTLKWRTNVATSGRVRFGSSPGSLTQFADEKASVSDHEIVLTGLAPETRYYYSIGLTDGTILAGDATYFFSTSPPAGTSRPIRIWALGDSGRANPAQAAVRDAFLALQGTAKLDFWMMMGDNAYETGTDAEHQATLFDRFPTLLRQAPLWPTLGNHETAQLTDFVDTYPYFAIWTLPTQGEIGGVASGTEHYYSFDYANVHVICLDSMTASRSNTGAMANWLRADLAQTTADWLIAFWHHPPYSKGSHNSDAETQLIEMRQVFVPILESAGVDLLLSGHSHSYERSFLLDGHYGDSSTFTAAMKIDAGNGQESGSGTYLKPGGRAGRKGAVYTVIGQSCQAGGGTLDHPAMYKSLAVLGSLVLDLNGNRLDARLLRETGAIDDFFTIIKNIAPTVTLTAPAPGAAFAAPANVSLLAMAADADGVVAKVDFFRDNVLFFTSTGPAYSALLGPLSPGGYSLTARATDNRNFVTTSAPVGINVLADTDLDGMPDVFETTYGFDPNNPSDAGLDSDGDGFTNLQEFLAGTNPRDSQDALRITQVDRSGGVTSLQFRSAAGKRYLVEWTTDLAVGGWTTLADDIAGTGFAVSVPDPGAGVQRKFYRVRLKP